MHLWEADLIAESAHRGQKDKIGVDYIHHVRAVSAGLAAFHPEVRIGGLLHDVVEDTHWTLPELRRAGVPGRSLRIIDAVTKRPGMTKEEQIEQVIAAGHDATLVKISDNAHNSLDSRIDQISSAKIRRRLREKYEAAQILLWRDVDPEDIEAILSIVNPPLLDRFRRTRRNPRPDIDTREVAERWLAGESMEKISVDLHCSPGAISGRIAKARTEFPDLPWADRKPTDRSGGSGVKGYVEMNDGKLGHPGIREGSIIKSRSLRNR